MMRTSVRHQVQKIPLAACCLRSLSPAVLLRPLQRHPPTAQLPSFQGAAPTPPQQPTLLVCRLLQISKMHANRTKKVQSQSFKDLLSTNPKELEETSNVEPEEPIPRGHARRGTTTATTPLPLELRSTRSRTLDADLTIDQVGPRSSFTEFMASARKVNRKSPLPSALHQ